jgi:hypothetical protein
VLLKRGITVPLQLRPTLMERQGVFQVLLQSGTGLRALFLRRRVLFGMHGKQLKVWAAFALVLNLGTSGQAETIYVRKVGGITLRTTPGCEGLERTA